MSRWGGTPGTSPGTPSPTSFPSWSGTRDRCLSFPRCRGSCGSGGRGGGRGDSRAPLPGRGRTPRLPELQILREGGVGPGEGAANAGGGGAALGWGLRALEGVGKPLRGAAGSRWGCRNRVGVQAPGWGGCPAGGGPQGRGPGWVLCAPGEHTSTVPCSWGERFVPQQDEIPVLSGHPPG